MKAALIPFVSLTFAIASFFSPEFGGFDPNRYPIPQGNSPVQSVGWAFAIWGIIYLVLIIHAFIGLVRHKRSTDWERGRMPLLVSLAVGTIWLTVATISPVWATLLIWVMLISALSALYRIREATPSWAATWPVALYAGWISAASFVSIGLLLAGYGVLTETVAAIVALACATLFAIINQLWLAQLPYAGAVAWGLTGIAIADYGEKNVIALLSTLAAAVLVATAIATSLSRRTGQHQECAEIDR